MPAAQPGRGGSENHKLYRIGRRYLRKLPPSTEGKYDQAVLRPIAEKYATSVAEVRTAVEFVAAVDRIVHTGGPWAKKLLLSGQNVLLTPVLVHKLAKRSPERLKTALQRAAEGLHPWARPVPKDTPPDLARWDYHLGCFERVGSWLEQKHLLRPASSLSLEERKGVYAQATATRVALSALLLALQSLGGSGRSPREQVYPALEGEVPPLTTVKRIRRVAEKLTHDVPLVLWQQGAPTQALKKLRSGVTRLRAWATSLAEHTRVAVACPPASTASLLRDHSSAPDAGLGTYIVILQSDQPAVRRIGRLETFWLPAGYFLYVGSACQSGGVAARTARHGKPGACRMWNLDHIKAIARPVEVWWTHHGATKDEKVECPWALALAELPDYFCPAPRFGGNDCKSCPAHLYYTARRPSCTAFAAVVRGRIPSHGPIYRHCFP